MQVYLIKRVMINNTNGETVDDISRNSSVTNIVFTSQDDAKKSLNDLYENDKEEFLEYTEEGYYEKNKSANRYHIQVWDEFGQGINIDCSIEKLELH